MIETMDILKVGGLALIFVLMYVGFKNAPKGKNSGKGGGNSNGSSSSSSGNSSNN